MNEVALDARMAELGYAARDAARAISHASGDDRNRALETAAILLRERTEDLLAANGEDVAAARAAGLSGAMIDRLALDPGRIEAIARALETIAALPDPLGRILGEWTRPNGLNIQRVSVPIGVIAIIFESRPNVTADAGAICLKSGNAVILRGGSESARSSAAIHACLADGLSAAGLPRTAVQLMPTQDRAAVGHLLAGLGGAIDLVIPRGGKSLVARVQRDARVPVLGHLEGICHVYVDGAADLERARAIVLNAKMRRTGICGAAETLLIDRACAQTHLKAIANDLIAAGCALRGDEAARKIDSRIEPASDADWDTEYLDAILSVRIVDGVSGALTHIAKHGTQHTDAIVTEDEGAARRFMAEADSAIVLHNASTQFADGGEFGFGAEVGIATGRVHARGPVSVNELTTYKYLVHGTGQTRE
jgi:glutamate-5-semialdehyde dehydrogenase